MQLLPRLIGHLTPAACLVSLTLAAAPAAATTMLLGPTPYLGLADSPFSATVFTDYFHLEDFEDGALNTPGVTSATGGFVIGPSDQTDSVDSDDGVVDGSGIDGHSFFSGFPGGEPTFTFEFDAIALGGLPTHAGVVWTDVGNSVVSLGIGEVIFEAFDSTGASLGVIGPTIVGDGSTFGQTDEDRFFGVMADAGIGRIVVSMAGSSTDWEVDHLQYGRLAAVAVPAPPALGLALLGLGLLAATRRRAT